MRLVFVDENTVSLSYMLEVSIRGIGFDSRSSSYYEELFRILMLDLILECAYDYSDLGATRNLNRKRNCLCFAHDY